MVNDPGHPSTLAFSPANQFVISESLSLIIAFYTTVFGCQLEHVEVDGANGYVPHI